MMPDTSGCYGCEYNGLIFSGDYTPEGYAIFVPGCELGACKYEGGRERDDRDDMF